MILSFPFVEETHVESTVQTRMNNPASVPVPGQGRVDNPMYWINLYSVGSTVRYVKTYPRDTGLRSFAFLFL